MLRRSATLIAIPIYSRRISIMGPRTRDSISSVQDTRPTKRIKLDFVDQKVDSSSNPPKVNLKGKEKDNADIDEYPERVTSLWKVGAHVSAAGGVENSITNAASIGANAFALFLKSQRKWTSPPLKDASVTLFKARMQRLGYEARHILPHGSYLINLGNPDDTKREKSFECFLDDLQRCEQLGLLLYNFHPGSTVGDTTTAASISLIAGCINRAHEVTSSVITVLENMAGAGNIIGSEFTHLSAIIAEVHDKTRVGVCLDTCHMFAAGNDIRTKEGWEATLASFDQTVGLTYLRGMHLNDSKTELSSHRDRHENLGIGHIGLPAFKHILSDPRVQNIPLILETPSFEKPEVWAREIQVLNRLSDVSENYEDTYEFLGNEVKHVVTKAGGSGKLETPAKKKKTKTKGGMTKGKRSKTLVAEDEDEHVH